MLKRNIALLLIPLLLGACATPLRVNLTTEQRAKISELKPRVIVIQDEVIAAVMPSQVSMATGGGLIGAMIDGAITNKRVQESQKIMGPFYAAIENVDYRKEFDGVIRQELAKYPIKTGQIVSTPRMFNNAELARLTDELQPGQALLVIVPRYFLTMDFRNLDSEAWVTMWVKGQTAAPIHRGVLYYQSKPVGTGGKASIDLWAAGNAELFRTTMHDSVAEMTKLILMEVEVSATPAKTGESKLFAFNTGVQQVEIKGRQLQETASRTVMLGDDGKIYSLPKAQSAAVAQR
ncbi:MAG: hypothetical protein Q7U91_16235 [Sideroxyarcus sp.]|nr:hypothetical protein [Sideroxyarcus sp.]